MITDAPARIGHRGTVPTIIDLFCGAGGSTTGAKKAGAKVILGLNHWDRACEVYGANHPDTTVVLTDISTENFRRFRAADVLVASPECTRHALAAGKKRKNEAQMQLWGTDAVEDMSDARSRATMWCVVRYCEEHLPLAVIVENVVEAAWYWPSWNPWLAAMRNLGYRHQVLSLNAMFFGETPQSRDRLYVVFTRKELRRPKLNFKPKAWCEKCGKNVHSVQSWKDTQMGRTKIGRYRKQYVYRCPDCTGEAWPYYHPAFNAINFSKPITRIGDRSDPLQPATIKRITFGLQKFHGRPWPFLFNMDQAGRGEGRYRQVLFDATSTQTTWQSQALAIPFLANLSRSGVENTPLDQAFPTQTTTEMQGLVMPFIASQYGGRNAVSPIDAALPTQSTLLNHYLVMPFIAALYGNASASSLDEPLSTVVAGGIRHALIAPFMITYDRTNSGEAINEPLTTVTTMERHGLVIPGAEIRVDDCGFRMLDVDEIQKAMGFPGDYILMGTKKEQVKLLGNANPPPQMDVISKAVFDCLG